MARPSKLTPELTVKFVAALGRGLFIETAAASAGIGKATVYRWLKTGREKPASPHGEFRDAVKKVLADVEAEQVEVIRQRQLNWQAAAWILERRWPGRWASYKGQVNELKRLLAEIASERQAFGKEGTKGDPPEGGTS
jgi:transposase